MKKLSGLPNYNTYKSNDACRNPKSAQRKQIADFTHSAFEGKFDVVYLTEANRKIAGDNQSAEYIELLTQIRFGRCTQRHLILMKELTASKKK